MILLAGAAIVLPDRVLEGGTLIVENDRIAAIEGLDARERLPEFGARIFEKEMAVRNAFDNRGHLVVIRHEDAVDRQNPQRDAAEFPERLRRAFDVSSFCI